MSAALVLRNLGAWSAQVAVLWLAAVALQRLTPLQRPAARLGLGQALLALVVLLPTIQPWQTPSASLLVQTSLGPAGPVVAPPLRPAFEEVVAWPAIVLAALAAGALLQLGRLALGLLRLRRIARAAQPLAAEPWLQALRDAVAPRAVLALSDDAVAPATFGLGRPTILLPRTFPALAREMQRAVALHELVHVRRRDWEVQLLEEVVRSLAFFHPAVHWLVGRVRLAREQCVDAAVVSRLGGREVYLESLVKVARQTARARAVPAAPFLRESHLRERVDLLLKEVFMSRARTAAHLVLTTAALLLALGWAASALPLQADRPASDTAKVALQDATSAGETKLVHKVNPVYPPEAKAEKVEGVFLIDALIGKDGAVKEARVVASAPTSERLHQLAPAKGTKAALEGDGRLAESAVAAVKQWRYQPVQKEGKVVEAKITITVAFKLS